MEKNSENSGAYQIVGFSFDPMLIRKKQDNKRDSLSSSVVTWSKELDLKFKPKLEVELILFNKSLTLNLGTHP